MAKKALLDVLEKTIGKYVLNLDAESLNIAVWNGTIELNSLEVNIQAVNEELDRQAAEAPNLAVPFRVTSGKFNSFQVDVPWANLMSRPVVMRAKGLAVEVEPFDRTASADFLYAYSESEAIRAKKIEEHRVKSIQLADDYRKQANVLRKLAGEDLERSNKAASSTTTGATFAARLVRRIIENVQIEISDVHISLKGTEGSAGVVLKSLQLVTTDSTGTRTFVDRTTGSDHDKSFLYKALNVRGLGLYLDEDPTKHSLSLASIREDENDDESLKHSYVLAPLSFDATLRQADSNVCIDFPKYQLESQLKSLSILFSKVQLELSQHIARQIQPSENSARPLFPEYRPLKRVKEAPREWWMYATRCIGRLNGRRAWVEFFVAFRARNRYIPLYKRLAHSESSPWIVPLTALDKVVLDELEHDRSISIEGLMTWRNIADAQVEKERLKHNAKAAVAKGSLFSSLFGGPSKGASHVDDDPPVALTVEEMKELEAVSMEQISDAELSKDSRLADIKFVLGSLNIHLTSYDLRSLATLDMGTVTTSLDANADGSFHFDFALASLEISDRATPNSLFPSVLKNQLRSGVAPTDSENQAFRVHVAKTKTGDQHLRVLLNTFEAVASPILLQELKRFVSASPLQHKSRIQNPILAQSMSGSVDLFYDAAEGSMHQLATPFSPRASIVHSAHGPDLSHTLVEAWKNKTETKAAWVIDLDIHAPIIVLPENCVNARANVLVFDLGLLRLKYGKIGPSPDITKWYKDNPRPGTAEAVVDNGVLSIEHMTFVVGKANYWHRLVRTKDSADAQEASVYEPMSLTIDFSVESVPSDDLPRICAFGVIPQIALKISPAQGRRILAVARTWGKMVLDLFPEPPTEPLVTQTGLDEMSTASSQGKLMGIVEEARRGSAFLASGVSGQGAAVTTLFLQFRLQRFSLKVDLDDGDGGIEAYLISVAVNFSSVSDASSCARLTMGWFWIIDRFQHEINRKQRLLVHSSLPTPAQSLAANDRYDVVGELEKIGAFDLSFAGSKPLADITFRQAGSNPIRRTSPFDPGDQGPSAVCYDSVLDARFTSLFVNWNPLAVKILLGSMTKFHDIFDHAAGTDVGSLILSSPDQLRPRASTTESLLDDKESFGEERMFLLVAEMESFQVSLNSARDDLPVFIASMSSAEVSMSLSNVASTKRVKLALDEIRVSTPEIGNTLQMYRTILGLSPGQNDSLLTVYYGDGVEAASELIKEGTEGDYEACAVINVSPMRMVYIQAQVLTLVEYATEGILGAMAAQAASSAVLVAAEIVSPYSGRKLFRVKAVGFEVLLPRSATSPRYISVATGSLAVDYFVLPDPEGGRASLSLTRVQLSDATGALMQSVPVEIGLEIQLPSGAIGSKDDQAMVINVRISDAPFILSKSQYRQILDTLGDNISDPDLHIRDDTYEGPKLDTRQNDSAGIKVGDLTHAGAIMVDSQRRIYVNFNIASLSLVLLDGVEEIVRFDAIEAEMEIGLISDESRLNAKVALKDMSCSDLRKKAVGRQHVSLVYQRPGKAESSQENDAFVINYEARSDGSSSVNVVVGSPCIAFIPDAIADVLAFVQTSGVNNQKVQASTIPETRRATSIVQVDDTSHHDEIETSVVKKLVRPESTFDVALATRRCSVILVDLGSDTLARSQGLRRSQSVAESIVMEGIFHVKLATKVDVGTGQTMSLDAQAHCVDMEIYTAYGRDQVDPLQILEPAQLSVYFSSQSSLDHHTAQLDFRAAALTALDVTVSMRNVALLSAIMSSIDDCFQDNVASNIPLDSGLSPSETERIELLSSILQEADAELTTSVHPAQQVVTETSDMVQTVKCDGSRSVSAKLTLPEASLTLVNDLQGLYEALVRIRVRNVMAGGQIREGLRTSAKSPVYTGFDFTSHATVLADYFDMPSNDWKTLLVKPWEISTKCGRGPSTRFSSDRPSTTVDIESFPCFMSFSEQFLMSLASANQMWAIYSTATLSAIENRPDVDLSLRKSVAASAARTLTTSLPYAIENHSGVDIHFELSGISAERRLCANNSTEQFRFAPPRGLGIGGRRLYGQDLTIEKSIVMFAENDSWALPNLDGLIGEPRHAHELAGCALVTWVTREGKTTVLHVSSGLDLHSLISVPFSVSLVSGGRSAFIGTCSPGHHSSEALTANLTNSIETRTLGVPSPLLRDFRARWRQDRSAGVSLLLSPKFPEACEATGSIEVRLEDGMFGSDATPLLTQFDVACKAGKEMKDAAAYNDPFVFQATIAVRLVDGFFPTIDIALEPRAQIENLMPITVSVRTPMPRTFSKNMTKDGNDQHDVHQLAPGDTIEVFTPGPSIAVTVCCTDKPVAGSTSGWMLGWVDLPLVKEFRLPEPLRCEFPFIRRTVDPLSLSGTQASEFFIVEGVHALSALPGDADNLTQRPLNRDAGVEVSVTPSTGADEWRRFFVTVRNFAVDHTGHILFEQVRSRAQSSMRRSNTDVARVTSSLTVGHQVSAPFGAYGSSLYHGRVTLLPGALTPLRVLHLTMEGDEGMRKTNPFRLDDVAICEGGIESSPLRWEDGSLSGFYAYRSLVNPHQSELHIVPEYVVYNGSKVYAVRVKQPGGVETVILPGNIAPLWTYAMETAAISIEYQDLGVRSAPVRVDALGLRFAVVRSSTGEPVGSLALQTVVGTRDSRLVVKLGELRFGSLGAPSRASPGSSTFREDFIRLRIQWSELSIKLSEGRTMQEGTQFFFESALDRIRAAASPDKRNSGFRLLADSSTGETWRQGRERKLAEGKATVGDSDAPVCTVLLRRFTVDWQRVFKEEDPSQPKTTRGALLSPERSQLSIIVHNVQLRDETPGTMYPIVFDSTSGVSFFDLCIRFKGPLDSELVKVDLIDLNLAHANGVSERIIVSTSEEFVWKLLDLANRILVAAGEFAGVDMSLEWDDKVGGYAVTFRDQQVSHIGRDSKYTPPESDKLYDISRVRVSPFTMMVSFKRDPESSRYKLLKGVKGAQIMNYFTRRLKFKIDKAELKFARYDVSNVKGPPDRLIELLTTVYLSRMKLKFVTIMTAASFQDWKTLASRDGGDDEFVEGDILRVTGNLAGNTANYVLKNAGRGLGQGVTAVTNTLGEGIESASSAIGARAVGAGVNSLVSGVGDGVSDTIMGVGTGAGKALRGAGQGVGHVFGGVTGGAMMIGKGIGKGISTGDGRAVVSGFAEGATSVGTGVGQGVETVVVGAAEGVLSVGQGLFSGAKSIGKGISGAFRDWCSCLSSCCNGGEEETRESALQSPLLPRSNSMPPS